MKDAMSVAPDSRKKGAAATRRQSVIVCDDHAAIRAGVTHILEQQDKRIVGGCGAIPDLLALIKQHPDAIVVTDLGIDRLPFPDLMTLLRKASSRCRIVVYSMREAPGTIELCYDAGAIAFVPKSADPEEIVKAVESAGQGERYLPSSVASTLANFHIEGRRSPLGMLSEQEKEVLSVMRKDRRWRHWLEDWACPTSEYKTCCRRSLKKWMRPDRHFFRWRGDMGWAMWNRFQALKAVAGK